MPPASCTHTGARPALSFLLQRQFVNAPPRRRPSSLDGGVPAPWPYGLEPLPCTSICSAPLTSPPWRCRLLPSSTPQRPCHSPSRQVLLGRTRLPRKSLQPAPSKSVSSWNSSSCFDLRRPFQPPASCRR